MLSDSPKKKKKMCTNSKRGKLFYQRNIVQLDGAQKVILVHFQNNTVN